MRNKLTIAVLYAPGINCHEETAFAIELAKGKAKIVVIQDLLDKTDNLLHYDGLVIPGGFSWGDHLAAGRILAVHLTSLLREQIENFLNQNKPILGICNGFQVLTETGILPSRKTGKRSIALLQNNSARFESRWSELLVNDVDCIWTQSLKNKILRMPVAHAEGRLYCSEGTNILAALFYAKNGKPTEEYPYNPNGSPNGIAGITDKTGLILGLMPHPERAVLEWHGSTDGLAIFQNLVAHLLE